MEILKDPNTIGQIAIVVFLSVVFLQSSLDKIFDWRGNHDWLKGHFSQSLLASVVIPMLLLITLIELATGVMALVGIFCLIFCTDGSYALIAVCLSLLAYLMLIFGQRIAKDYDGARTIAIYFGVSLLSLHFFQ